MMRASLFLRLWRFVVLVVLGAMLSGRAYAVDAAPGESATDLGDAPVLLAPSVQLPAVPADFESRDAGFAVFRYHPSIRGRIEPLLESADAVRSDLTARLGTPVLDKVHVFVARTPREMAMLAPKGAPFPGYAAGVAYSGLGLVLLTVDPVHPGSTHDLAETFRHELAHIALHDAVGGQRVPRWFNEGFAIFASGESSLLRLQTLWTAALADNLLSLEQMERTFPADPIVASVAYAEAGDLVRFLVRSRERHRFAAMIERLRAGNSFADAMTVAYGTDPSILEQEWRQDVAKRYTFWPVLVSGTTVWGIAMVLFVWAWRRKRRDAARTLARWTREEAAADRRALVALLEARQAERAGDETRADRPAARVYVTRRSAATPNAGPPRPAVPKVEHDGTWHTLH